MARFKDRVRDLTRRHRGVSLERMVADLNPLLRGWAGYFGVSQLHELASLRRVMAGGRAQAVGGQGAFQTRPAGISAAFWRRRQRRDLAGLRRAPRAMQARARNARLGCIAARVCSWCSL